MELMSNPSSGGQLTEAPDLQPSQDDNPHAELEPQRTANPQTAKRARRRLRLWEQESHAENVLCEENLDEQLLAHRVLDRHPAQVIQMLLRRPRDLEALKGVLHDALRRGEMDSWPLVSYGVHMEQLERLAPVRVQSLTQLDDTTMLSIFGNLPVYDICGEAPTGIASVCRHWERLSRNPGLWKVLSFTHKNMPNAPHPTPYAVSYRIQFAWMLLQKSGMSIQRFVDSRCRQLQSVEFTINTGRSRSDMHPNPSRWWMPAMRTILEASNELRVLRITLEAESCGGFGRLFRLGSAGSSKGCWNQPSLDSNRPGECHPRVDPFLFSDAATLSDWGAIRQNFDSLETLHLAMDSLCGLRLLPSLPSLKSLHLLNAGSISFHEERAGYVHDGEEPVKQALCSRRYPGVTDLLLHYHDDHSGTFSLVRHNLNGTFMPSKLESLALFNVPFDHLWSWLGCTASGIKLPLRRLILSHMEEPFVRGLHCLPSLIELKLFSLTSDDSELLVEALTECSPQIQQVDLGSKDAPVHGNIPLRLAEKAQFPCLQESNCFIFNEVRPIGESGDDLPPNHDFRMRVLRHRISRTECFWCLNHQFSFYETHFHAHLRKLNVVLREGDAPRIEITGKKAWIIEGLQFEFRYDFAREDLEAMWERLPAEIRAAYTTQIAPALSEAAIFTYSSD